MTSPPDIKLGSEATVLRRLRAAEAREYSFSEEYRRPFRDGFTQGWEAAKLDSQNRTAKKEKR